MQLKESQRKVLQFLADNASEHGTCYRYVRDIAKAVQLSPNYVRKITGHLVKFGFIERVQQWATDSDIDYTYPDMNEYTILKHPPDARAKKRRAKMPPRYKAMRERSSRK